MPGRFSRSKTMWFAMNKNVVMQVAVEDVENEAMASDHQEFQKALAEVGSAHQGHGAIIPGCRG